MYDRSKNPTYVGFYDSVFEKPDMWRLGLEFSEASGLGKDVYAPLHNLVKRVVWERTFTPHSMYDRSKNPTYVGFYDSVFEKPDMWPRGLEFSEASGLGKDVYAPLHV
ncbi:hypothetical protein TNCV_1699181 [Trichonephila clavipes]|nr:hypothetical protein TNCV_1699181 [Trichonephila clavipes]